MKKAPDQDLQDFIKASAMSKMVTNPIQTQNTDEETFRQKYTELIKKIGDGYNEAIEADWEEVLRRKNEEAKSSDYQDAIATRKYLKWILLSIIVIWLLYVAIIVILQGFNINFRFHNHHIYFRLANSVMNMLLGTTTASVFGLYKVVINYFFNQK
jgi:hypothetical protein